MHPDPAASVDLLHAHAAKSSQAVHLCVRPPITQWIRGVGQHEGVPRIGTNTHSRVEQCVAQEKSVIAINVQRAGDCASKHDLGDLVEYGYTATHPDVSVAAGECVWIEIRNDTTGSAPTCIWLWSTAPSSGEGGLGDAVSWQNDNLRDFDLAFCLNEPLGDPSTCAWASRTRATLEVRLPGRPIHSEG